MSTWTDRQTSFLIANPDMSAEETAARVSEIGPARTALAVERKRNSIAANVAQAAARAARAAEAEQKLVGFDPAKDAAYVRLLVKEGLRCGALKVAA